MCLAAATVAACTLVVSSVVRRDTDAGLFDVPTRTSYAFPLKVRHEIVVNGRTLAIASAPGGGAVFTEGGALPLDEGTRVGIERATMRHPLVLLKARLGRGFRAEHAGVERIDERDVDLVRVVQVGNETLLAIDRHDGRLVEIRYQLAAKDGSSPIVVRFDDWQRTDGGIRSPRIARGFERGREVLTATTGRVDVDVALPESLFTADIGTAGLRQPAVSPL